MSLPRVRFTAQQLMLAVAAIAMAFYFYTGIRLLETSLFSFARAHRWLADVPELRAIGAPDVAENRLIAARDDYRNAWWCHPPPVMVIKDGRLIEAVQADRPVAVPDDSGILEGEGETRSSIEPAGRPFPTRLTLA
jgi:hypothetical protein